MWHATVAGVPMASRARGGDASARAAWEEYHRAATFGAIADTTGTAASEVTKSRLGTQARMKLLRRGLRRPFLPGCRIGEHLDVNPAHYGSRLKADLLCGNRVVPVGHGNAVGCVIKEAED